MNLQTKVTRPKPLDNSLRLGIELSQEYDTEDVLLVQERLNYLFDRLRADKSKELRECIAWAVSLEAVEENEIDISIIETAKNQNHGMISYEPTHNDECLGLWSGEDTQSGAKFDICRKSTHIVLDDDTIAQNGLIYYIYGPK